MKGRPVPIPARPSDHEAIEATAAAWLAQRDDGLSAESEAEFARWRAGDPRHEAAVARLERAWSALQQLRDFRPEAQRHPDRDLLRARSGRRVISFPTFATVALAASIALAAVGWFVGATRAAEHRYTTTVDGYERMALEDGSLLELNADSEVRVHFTRAERRVRLVRGEAHFTVTKNPARPFMVEAGTIAVRAIGTAFNVRLGASDVEVLVTEGRVVVGPEVERGVSHPPLPSSQPAVPGGQRAPSVFLAVNQRALISTARPASAAAPVEPIVEEIAPDAVREALAWQGPRLVFVDTPLVDAIAQFNRRNPVQLVLADPELEAVLIGGSFRAQNVDAFVRLLASGNDIATERPDALRIVLRKAK